MSLIFDESDFSADDSVADPEFIPEKASRKRRLDRDEPSTSKVARLHDLPSSSIFCSEFYTDIKQVCAYICEVLYCVLRLYYILLITKMFF